MAVGELERRLTPAELEDWKLLASIEAREARIAAENERRRRSTRR